MADVRQRTGPSSPDPVAGDDGTLSTGVGGDGRPRARASQPQIGVHGFLTPQDEWGDVERGNPLPYTLPPEKRWAVGLERETWRLEVVADPASNSQLEAPLSRELGTALDFDGLLKLGREHGVRYLKAVTCNNLGEPLGMGLWEGVPLRVVVWQARPVANVRRVRYTGYHNDDPLQIFESTLPIWRVLEDPPGEMPVILAYKLNGEWISGKRGGPVRMVVPEGYGFKSVKWLQRVVLTNHYGADDTYQLGNNDLDSPMKTFARFLDPPTAARAGQPIPIRGIAQVGVSGLAKVQYWVHPSSEPLSDDDPNFERGDWRDAEILPPPADWVDALPGGAPANSPVGFDGPTPRSWPLRYTVVHWATELPPLAAGAYDLRCRSVDLNGIAQPMPRPFAKGGRSEIQTVPLEVRS
jgi:DMSO/TMAO reductase YedYZ molybdopterin-dependent catalytic subunit